MEGVSSVDTEEIIEALDEEIRNSCALHGLKGGWFVDKTGKAYIHEALIGNGTLSTNYSVKMNVDFGGKRYAAGMSIGQASVDAQTASIAVLQQAVHDAVNDALRNALKPGGLLYKR
ncbi:DUF1983 domain-containing protein [Enterobacter hormaechei]|nr:DUF1983 domain-containing protein [Enterobacter hormaechei]